MEVGHMCDKCTRGYWSSNRPPIRSSSFTEPLEGRLLLSGNVTFTSITDGDFNADGVSDQVMFARLRRAQRILAASGSLQIGRGLFVVDGTLAGSIGAVLPLGSGGRVPIVAAGDFNGDGAPDLAVANRGSGRALEILLNDGTGAFTSATRVTAASGVTSLAAADVNGDGRADLVVGTVQTTSVSRRRGSAPPDAFDPALYLENRRQFLTGHFVAATTGTGVSAEAGGGTGLPGSIALGFGADAPGVDFVPGPSSSTPMTFDPLFPFAGGSGAAIPAFGAVPGVAAEAGGAVALVPPVGISVFNFGTGVSASVQTGAVVVLLGNGDGTFLSPTPLGGTLTTP